MLIFPIGIAANRAWFSCFLSALKLGRLSLTALPIALTEKLHQTSSPCKEESFWFPSGLDSFCLQ